jgi:monoamine oxidase
LSPQRRALSQRMPQTAVIKFHVAYDQPFWRDHGYSGQVMSDELPLGLVMEDTDTMLAGFAYGRHALALSAMGDAARQKAVVDCLVDLFGPDASEPVGYADKDWLVDEWSRGFTGSTGPGVLTQYGAALGAPCGRIHWAGSETATQWAGYMEGALESGERAASEVLA